MCVNCTKIETAKVDDWLIELDMNKLNLNEMTESSVEELLEDILTGTKNLTIGTEVDDGGNILRFIIYVPDESVAESIVKRVKDCKNTTRAVLQLQSARKINYI